MARMSRAIAIVKVVHMFVSHDSSPGPWMAQIAGQPS